MMHQRLQSLGLKSLTCQAVIVRLNDLKAQGRLNDADMTKQQRGAAVSESGGLTLEESLRLDPYLVLTRVKGVNFRYVGVAHLQGMDHLNTQTG